MEKIKKFKINGLTKFNNKYDYSLVYFKRLKDYIKIICPEHGLFEQRVDVHLKGEGCNQCYLTKRGINNRLSNDSFIKKAIIIHGNKYDYTNTTYIKNNEYLKIICKNHGEFNQMAQAHLNGSGCPICKESKGENKIRLFLKKHEINFIHQYIFNNCKNNRVLPFDFYLPDLNICIEYNGIQHYESIKHFGGNDRLKKQIRNDNIKLNFCYINNITLIIVKYNENIEDVLKTNLYLKIS